MKRIKLDFNRTNQWISPQHYIRFECRVNINDPFILLFSMDSGLSCFRNNCYSGLFIQREFNEALKLTEDYYETPYFQTLNHDKER